MKISMEETLKSGTNGWVPAVLVTAALLFSIAAPVRAHDDGHHDSDDRSFGSKTLARVFHDTYWRWFNGKLTLPTDENTNAVLNGTALMPLPHAPGDGTPGSIDITLKGGQPFFLPLFGEIGTSYTDGTPPDAILDLSIFRTLIIKFTIDGKTIVDRRNVMDFYSQFAFVPPMPFNSRGIDSLIWFQSISVLGEPLSPGKHVLKLDVKNTIQAFGFIGEYHNTQG